MATTKGNSASNNPGKGKAGKKSFAGIEGSDAIPSIFDGGSDLIAGELILQLEEKTAAAVTESIPRGPSAAAEVGGISKFGIGTLDGILANIGTTSIVRLHPPVPGASKAMSAEGLEEATLLATTFKVCCDRTKSIEEAAEKLASVSGVKFAEPNRYRETYITPNDPQFTSQWGLTKINAPDAWDRTTGSPNVVVAVIDTGIDLDHPELAPLLVQGMDMVDLGPNPTAPQGFRFEGDFQTRDNIPQDEVGHGTHVAGTIACLSNNNRNVAGVTWQCRLMPVKVLTRIVNINNINDVRGTGSAADIAAGIRWAVDNGARILNLSLGGTTDTQVERDAIAYAISRGVVVCAAMGNGGANAPVSFPAAYPGVVAVGAINISNQRAGFSQVGAHIDVVAPGVDILSTVWNDSTTTMSGTSMASPHVAGVAALVLSCNSALTGAQVADILRQTAQPLRDNPGDPIPNNNYGFGCVDAKAALDRACPSPPVTTPIRCNRSLVVQCVTAQIRCTRTITCRPSVVVQCPSIQLQCPTRGVECRPSVLVRCPSATLLCNQNQPMGELAAPSTMIRCASSSITCTQTIACRPSVLVACQTLQIRCARLTRTIYCRTLPVYCAEPPAHSILCGGPVPSMACGGPQPGQWGQEIMGSNEDNEYLEDYSALDDWAGYDPYGIYYGEEDLM